MLIMNQTTLHRTPHLFAGYIGNDHVLDGTEYPNGSVTVAWLNGERRTTVFDDFEHFSDGVRKVRVEWL
jgi:hypothetical protein